MLTEQIVVMQMGQKTMCGREREELPAAGVNSIPAPLVLASV